MLQPKSKVFKLKFHLAKVEAANNKVNSRVHAYLMIDNQQLQFQGAPELKKNIAIFGSDLQYENFMIGYDQVTGLYEDKRGLVVIEFETMGAYIKVGEVSVNLGEILNEKKYRVVNVYPLSKCYDKTAKIKLAVDFIPQTRGSMQQGSNINNKRTMAISSTKQTSTQTRLQGQQAQHVNNSAGMAGSGYYKNPTGMIKSRLAEEENAILQERVYEYEKRMDSYRNAQNQLSEKMQQQMQRKDDKIGELSLQVSKLNNSLHLLTLESESLKVEIKSVNEQKDYKTRECKQLKQQLEQFNKKVLGLQKQLQTKSISIQNMTRTHSNKQKHLNGEIHKYTLRYSQSQQQRNRIIFQLQNKLKQQLQKKDQHYQQLLRSNQEKYLETIKAIKQRNKYLQKEYKLLQEVSEQQENRLKAVTLQLSKSIAMNRQKQQQMVYMNQESNKLSKLNQTLTNEIDSLNFSYQQIMTQLTNLKQLNKQLNKKLQHTKTQLSLSNQTITQLNQRITQMNKQLQVHSQRQYYMKEHYQQQLYDLQLSQTNTKTHNQQLQSQLTKHKQQLKLTQQKLEQQQNKTNTLKITIQTYQKQLHTKNSLLIKLNQQKILLQTTTKTHLTTIHQLQNQITHLEQQKIYLSQNIMDKKISIENQKSLEWTYKIQSLQNDIQVLVDKFKLQKQSLKQQHKKQQQKRIQQINTLTNMNKKVNQNLDDLKDKLTKRQSYLVNVQKSLKLQKDKSLQLQRQLNTFKQTIRAVTNEKQSYQQTVRDLSRQKESYIKSINQLEAKTQRQRKELASIKTSFHRLISMILEYMVKRYTERVSFQQVSVDGVDTQMMGYVNVALKKYCEEHNRTRDLVKQLQEWKKQTQNEGTNLRSIKSNNNTYDSMDNKDEQTNNNNYYTNSLQKYSTRKSVTMNRLGQQQEEDFDRKSVGRNQYATRALSPSNRQSLSLQFDPSQTVEAYRVQIDRLKKEQSQYRVKIKSQQQEIQKQQRNVQNTKFQTNRLKSQLQETQDQLTRIGFVIRKKDKIIKQLQGQLQQIQKENLQLKSNPQYVLQKARQRLNSCSNQQLQQSPPSFMAIRELESRLNLKEQQLSHVQRQLQTLRTQYLTQLNNVKRLQSRLKQKSQKVVSLQKQVQQSSSKQNDTKDKQNTRLKKQLSQQQQEKYLLEEKNIHLQSVIKQLQTQLSNLQQRNRQLHQQFKSTQLQFRRNLQSSEYQMNDKSTFYQTEIMQLKSQLSQLQDKVKELAHKNAHLTQSLNKKNAQLQTLKDKLALTEKDMLKNQQINDEYKNKMLIKSNALNDRIRQLQSILQTKQFQLEQCKFAYQGRVLDLQRQIDDFINTPVKATAINVSP